MKRAIALDEAVAHPLVRETLVKAWNEQELIDLPRPVGQGAGGVVFRVTDPAGRIRALKIPNYGRWPADQHVRLRTKLRKEARHLNVAACAVVPRLLHCEAHGAYLMREYVDGTTLDRLPEPTDGELIRAVLACTRQLFATTHEHPRAPYVVRDLRSGNLVRQHTGERAIIFVDVGGIQLEAKMTGDNKKGLLGGGGARYRSPEYLLNEKRTMDRRTDYFSLGVIIYELVTGDAPYANREANRARVLDAYLTEYPGVTQRVQTALHHLGLAPDTVDFVVRCLHPRAAERPRRFFQPGVVPVRSRLRRWIGRR